MQWMQRTAVHHVMGRERDKQRIQRHEFTHHGR